MSQANYQSLRFVRIRVSKVTAGSGAPLVGSANAYVSNAQIQAQISMNTTPGDDFTQANGNGDICATMTDADKLKSVGITMDLCAADPILRSFLTGGTLLTDPAQSSLPVGYQAPSTSGTLDSPVCLEGWTKAWDGTAQAVPTSTSPLAAYWHWVFPYCKFVEDTTTLNNGIATFPVKGVSTENTGITTNGPLNDWPLWVAQNGGITRCYGYFLDGTTLPTVTDARIAVPSGS